MRTVLVTAAGGNAGRHCVGALMSKGFKVVATARDPAKLQSRISAEVRRYDANGTNDFETLLAGIDDLVLITPPSDGGVYEKVAPLIDAAARHRLGHIVHLSGNYLSGMTGSTLAALPIRKIELHVEATGLTHTIVRAGFFMDNYLSGFYSAMVEQGRLALATGDGKSALVAAVDVAAFVAECLTRKLTGEYIVTGPAALDHYEVADMLSSKLGRRIVYTPITEDQLAAVYASKGVPPESVDYGLTLYRAYRNHATAAVTDGFRQAMGREPVDFATFLGLP